MRQQFKFILFALLFNIAAFFVASTGWFPNTLYGNAVGDLSLSNPATLSSAEDIFLRMVENDIGANIISNALGLSGAISFAILLTGLIGGAAVLGWLSKGSGTTIIGMAVIAYLFYTMYNNSKNFFDSLLSNLPAQVSYITLMIGVGLLFTLLVLMIDFSSGQKSTS